MDEGNKKPARKEIINAVYKPKRPNGGIRAAAIKNTMNLFMANKQMFMGVSLNEIKGMTPQEAYLFGKQVEAAAKAIELERLKHGI